MYSAIFSAEGRRPSLFAFSTSGSGREHADVFGESFRAFFKIRSRYARDGESLKAGLPLRAPFVSGESTERFIGDRE